MRSWTPFGSARRMSSTAPRMPAATVTVSAPNCLMTRALTTSPFSRCATPAPHRRRFANVGDVAEQHRHVAARGHDRAAQVVNGLRAAERAHRPFDRALRDDAAGGVHVRLLDGVHHIVEADAPRRHALGIELHLELSQIAAEPLDSGDAGHGRAAGC